MRNPGIGFFLAVYLHAPFPSTSLFLIKKKMYLPARIWLFVFSLGIWHITALKTKSAFESLSIKELIPDSSILFFLLELCYFVNEKNICIPFCFILLLYSEWIK